MFNLDNSAECIWYLFSNRIWREKTFLRTFYFVIITIFCEGKAQTLYRRKEKRKERNTEVSQYIRVGFQFVFRFFALSGYYTFLKMKTNVMAMHQYPVFAGKQDILREVVMKYIDHFYPK